MSQELNAVIDRMGDTIAQRLGDTDARDDRAVCRVMVEAVALRLGEPFDSFTLESHAPLVELIQQTLVNFLDDVDTLGERL